MDLASILRVLGRRALIIFAFVLAGMVVAAATQLTIGPDGLQPRHGAFRARTRLLLDIPGADGSQALSLVMLGFSHKEVVMTQTFAEEISERVGGAYSPQEVYDQLKAFPIAPSQVLQIEMTADSREDAVALAEAAAATYRDWLSTHQEDAGVPERARILATVLETSDPSEVVPASLEANSWLVFGAIVGASLGIVFAFGLPVPDPKTKRSKPQVAGLKPRRRPVSLPQLTRSSRA